jgi:hypothetical protein
VRSSGRPAAQQTATVIDIESQVRQHVGVMLAQPQEVHSGPRRLRDDSERVHSQIVHLAEVQDYAVSELRESCAQLERLGEIEGAA